MNDRKVRYTQPASLRCMVEAFLHLLGLPQACCEVVKVKNGRQNMRGVICNQGCSGGSGTCTQ